MSVEAVSESAEALLKQIFKGDDFAWPEESGTFAEELFAALNFHGLVPVFWYWINQHEFYKNWPSSFLSSIKNVAVQQAAFDLLLESELKNILQAMDDIDIHPLLMKGTPLSYTLYPAPGLRPRCDTDFLIAKEDFETTAKLMNQFAYQAIYDGDVESISSQKTFVNKDKLKVGHAYDIHWQSSNNSRSFSQELNYLSLLQAGRTIPRLGKNARMMGNIDALLLACFHRAGHFSYEGDRLIWLYDIHLLLGTLDEHEFDLFLQKARKMAIATICADAILTAQEWFNTHLTEPRLKRLNTLPKSESSSIYLVRGRKAGIKNHALLKLAGLSSLRDKSCYLYQKIFPPVNYMLWRYDTKQKYLLPFLYLYRLIYGVYIFVRR